VHLTSANLAHYLIERGLVGADEIVAGAFSVVDASRRNRNFKVFRQGRTGLFVKQMRDLQTDAAHTLRREAICYEAAAGVPELARIMPRLLRYDDARHTLVTELAPEAESLLAYHQRFRTFPVEIGVSLGEALGTYHGVAGALLTDPRLTASFARQIPVILTLRRGGHAALGHFGLIGPQASALIRQHPDFESMLDALAAGWRTDSLIHGDMKWDNVLVYPTDEGLDFRVVDWEMADFGDAAWDVGAVIQSFLTAWILSMPIASGLPPAAYVGMAREPLEAMHPVFSAFWRTYAAKRGWDAALAARERERCLSFGAARLAWAAIEQRVFVSNVDSTATAMLQVSFNILKDPARAVRELLNV
jgi:hypothetical protein